jgi:hypothetical protein
MILPMSDLFEKLDPDVIKGNLTQAALYLVTYEILKGAVIRRVAGFFTDDFRSDGSPVRAPEYASDVLSRGPNVLQASLLWLQAGGALVAADIADFDLISKHRHELAHELPRLLVDPALKVDLALVFKARAILRKVDLFFLQIAADTDPDFDGVAVNSDTSKSGEALLLEYVDKVLNEGAS